MDVPWVRWSSPGGVRRHRENGTRSGERSVDGFVGEVVYGRSNFGKVPRGIGLGNLRFREH